VEREEEIPMPHWTELDIPTERMKEVAGRRGVDPIRLYVTEFDTNVEVERDVFLMYLLDPLPVLTGQATRWKHEDPESDRELDGLVLDGVEDDWSVVTVLRNHHRGLNPRVNFMLATVSSEEKTVYQDIYKQLE
jgi:hypothetical protein